MQRAAGVWAGRAVAPAFRKLSACGEARRMLRHALAGWAQREMAAALRQWCAMHLERLNEERLMRRSTLKVPLWQCPTSPPAPPQGAPGGSGRLLLPG